jgi:hypothetical protein
VFVSLVDEEINESEMHYYVTRELLPALALYSAIFCALWVLGLVAFLLRYAARQISRGVWRPMALAKLGYAERGGNSAGHRQVAARTVTGAARE